MEAVTRRGSPQSLQVFARVSEVQGVNLLGQVQNTFKLAPVVCMY